MPKQRIDIFIDANLFGWMPNIIVTTTPSNFNRAAEQCAFETLLQMRADKKICMSAWDEAIDNFIANQSEPVKTKMLSYFNNRISKNTTTVIAGEELADMVEQSQKILFSSGEKQDDVAVFVMTYIVRTEVSHVATCDSALHSKWKSYLEMLNSNMELFEYVKACRKWKPYFVGFPSTVLIDVQATLHNGSQALCF